MEIVIKIIYVPKTLYFTLHMSKYSLFLLLISYGKAESTLHEVLHAPISVVHFEHAWLEEVGGRVRHVDLHAT